MIIVAGHLLVHAADRDRYVAACAPAVEAARCADGCLDFAVSADVLDERRVNVFERWQSRPQLDAFRGGGPGDDLRERIVAVHVSEYELA
jgi:quinol monooxygenase YgiN